MKEQAWSFVDKSAWGAGEWQQEPDKLQFPDPATGLPCLIVRHPESGHLCGYVGVAEGHPLFGISYDAPCPALTAALQARLEQPVGETPGMGLLLHALCGDPIPETPECALQVHGGITFADHCREDREHGICHVPEPGEPAQVWWFGFDAAHCDDLSPGYARLFPRVHPDTYRTVDYMRGQCGSLAEQLHALVTATH